VTPSGLRALVRAALLATCVGAASGLGLACAPQTSSTVVRTVLEGTITVTVVNSPEAHEHPATVTVGEVQAALLQSGLVMEKEARSAAPSIVQEFPRLAADQVIGVTLGNTELWLYVAGGRLVVFERYHQRESASIALKGGPPAAPSSGAVASAGGGPAAAPAAPAALPPVEPPTAPVGDEPRTALVIGNGAYAQVGALRNPPNDARLVRESLLAVGFTVQLVIDADGKTMKRSINEFGERLQGGGVGLFYYAGHGLQANGKNYLLPVDVRIKTEQDIPVEGIDLDSVLAKLDAAQNRVNVVVLDACRNNPFLRSYRAVGQRGLALVDAPQGTIIAFSTAPGAVAEEGQGDNSEFSRVLAQEIRRPDQQIEDVFKTVRRAVKAASGGQQVPWESSSLEGDFSFVP